MEATETRARGYGVGGIQVKWSPHSFRVVFGSQMKNPNRGEDGAADGQAKERGGLISIFLFGGPAEKRLWVGEKACCTMGLCIQRPLLFRPSPFSPAEPNFTQTTLLKELKIQAGGGEKGSQQFIKWQQASQVGTGRMGGSEGEWSPAFNRPEAK